jgi:hypothetical protein
MEMAWRLHTYVEWWLADWENWTLVADLCGRVLFRRGKRK